MPRFRRFAEVVELDDVALRALLEGDGDDPERVWAAWALALRSQRDAGALFHEASAHDPSPGVRAHLALMLVAHGERAAAMTLARRDPDSLVRTSACRCLARTADPADHELAQLLAHALESDPCADVREAILDALRPDAPPRLRALVDARLHDDDRRVRAAAVEQRLRNAGAGEAFPASLAEQAQHEVDEALFARITDAWLRASGVASVVRTAATWPPATVARLLERCASLDDVPVVVDDLREPFARDDATIDRALASLHARRRLELPLAWVLAFVLRLHGCAPEHVASRRMAADLARERLPVALATENPTPEDRALAARLAAAIETTASAARGFARAEVEALARYERGEIDDAEIERMYREDWDDDVEQVDDIWLLPALQRLAARDDS